MQKKERIDHILLAVNDIDKGMAQFAQLTGVEPVYGGFHPNSFTQNALVTLDNDIYLEIIAPRHEIVDIPSWITKLDILTPYTWAIRSYEINESQNRIADIGLSPSKTKVGSRNTATGDKLTWTTFDIEYKTSGLFPFFIEWGSNIAHPSASAPQGCSLLGIDFYTMDQSLSIFIDNLQIEGNIFNEISEKLVFHIDTPKGKVTFNNHKNKL